MIPVPAPDSMSLPTFDVVGAVVGVDTLVLVVTVDTEKVEVNAPSPSTVDTGSDPDVITTGAETIGEKSKASLLIFPFPNMISQVKVFGIAAIYEVHFVV